MHPTSGWPTFKNLLRAYRECRLGKRASNHQTAFEAKLGKNLLAIHREIHQGSYAPSPVVCFVVTRPRPREIFAAHFRDRIVHHLVISRLSHYWERKFIHASFACREQKGTHGALRYLQESVRALSKGGVEAVYALQLDVASFFVTIHRPTLRDLMLRPIRDPRVRELAGILYSHDARPGAIKKGDLFDLIPSEKSWFSQPPDRGLPIGNLTSQFGANVYLTGLDHFIQRRLKPGRYLRYMDDLLLLDRDPEKLRKMVDPIEQWLKQNRKQALNPAKTKLIRLDQGMDYLGYRGRQTDHPKEPLQLFVEPKKKWEWISTLRGWNEADFESTDWPHPLSAALVPKRLQKRLPQVNSRLGYLRHARSYTLRKRALNKFLVEITENADLPPEMADPWCPLKVKRDLTAVVRR